MSMGKKVVGNAIGTSVTILSGIARNKIFAAILSLNVFGILSIGQQSASLLYTLFAFGVPLGITTIASQLVGRSEEEQRDELSRIVTIIALIAVVVLVILTAVISIDPELFSRLITGKTAYAIPIGLLIFSTPFMVIENSIYAILEGMGKLRQTMLFKLIPAVTILPITYFLTLEYHLFGAAMSVLIGEVFLCMVAVTLLQQYTTFSWQSVAIGPTLARILKVAVLSFIVGTSWLLTDFLVKRFILESLGEVSNAIVQSVAKVTDLYPMVALAWLSMHLFPVIAGREGDREFAARVIERTVLIAVAIVVPVILVLFTFRAPILAVIYGKDFVLADVYFGAMLATGVVKVVSWVLGVGLLAAGLRRAWFLSSILLNVFYLAGSWLGLNASGSVFVLPAMFGLGLLLQTIYSLHAYHKGGMLFRPEFNRLLLALALLTAILAVSVAWPLFLVSALLLYLVLVVRYDLVREGIARASEIIGQIPARKEEE